MDDKSLLQWKKSMRQPFLHLFLLYIKKALYPEFGFYSSTTSTAQQFYLQGRFIKTQVFYKQWKLPSLIQVQLWVRPPCLNFVPCNPLTVATRDFNTKILPHSPDKMQVIFKVMDEYRARVFQPFLFSRDCVGWFVLQMCVCERHIKNTLNHMSTD